MPAGVKFLMVGAKIAVNRPFYVDGFETGQEVGDPRYSLAAHH